MTELCMYAALGALAAFTPKAPAALVENMVKTVKTLAAERNHLLGTSSEPEKTVHSLRQTKKSEPRL